MDNKHSKALNKRMIGLGRGLESLLSDNSPSDVSTRHTYENIVSMSEINIHWIEANPFQPRTSFDQEALNELAESIRVQGIIQPITVRQTGKDRYQLISGERRLQASKLIGMARIPAYVRLANDQQMLEMALIENIQRENLNPIEIALSYQRLMSECNLRHEQLGERVGKNKATINNYIRLLKLPPIIQAALRDNELSMGHARALINVDDFDTQIHLFNQLVEEGWNVRKVEDTVRDLSNSTGKLASTRRVTTPKQEMRSLQFKLSSLFGTKVSIKTDENHKGEIKIPFASQDELAKILEMLNSNE